jgi:hypothetical protein
VVSLASKSLDQEKVLERFTEITYPYSRFYLREIKEGQALLEKPFFHHWHYSMNEACLTLWGVISQ